MNNNYIFILRHRRRWSQFPLLITHQNYEKKGHVPNTEKNNSIDKTDTILCSINKASDMDLNLSLYKEYLSKIKTYNLKILDLTEYYLKNPIDRSDHEFCEAFYQYSIKCITYLERTCYQKEGPITNDNISSEHSSDDNYMFDPFTIMEKPLGLHLSAFCMKKYIPVL